MVRQWVMAAATTILRHALTSAQPGHHHIADVVFNHFGKAGDSGPLWNYDSTTEEYLL